MLRRLVILFCILGLIPPALLAQTARGSGLIESTIRLQSLHIDTQISGGMAETTVQMEFFNPNARALEGNLQFPLLPQQRITAFALDIDGKLRPAVPVDKAKGRQVFEAIERRRVDPALLETSQGNNFKLRIYPIPAGASRTVQLKYAEPLTREGADWAYQLPLAYGNQVRAFQLTVTTNGSNGAPRTGDTSKDLSFVRLGDAYRASTASADIASNGTLRLLVPANPQAQTFIEKRDGETFFIAEIPLAGAAAPTPRALPKTVGLLWDSSGSGSTRQHQAELHELGLYFKALGNAEIRLTRLRDSAEAIQTFKLRNGNWDALRRELESTVYDGASALGDWRAQADVGEYLLLSDGLSNYGKAGYPPLLPGQRLYALNSALAADSGALAALAERSGGRLITVSAQTPGAAAQALLTEGIHISAFSASGATALQLESADPQSGMARIAGRLSAPVAEVRLTLSQNGKERTLTIPLSAAAPTHPLAAQLWASYRLHALEADYQLKRGEIRRIGQRFGLATRETSLIVLDRVEDYVRYEIAPPAALQAAYEQLRNTQNAQLQERRLQHLDSVVREFERKVAWWEAAYPKHKKALPKPERHRQGALREEAYGTSPVVESMPVLSPPSAPAPSERSTAGGLSAVRIFGAADAAAGAGAGAVKISLKKWTADAPYIDRMKAASAQTIYAIYLDEKPEYANSSAFYLDAADMLLEKGQRKLALRVLSNLAEMDLENRHVLRILAYRLLQAGAPELAIPVFEKVRQMAEEEPQSFRDLGLAHAAAGQHQLAVDQLNEVVKRPWDSRFAEIELIALAELNAIVAAAPGVDTSGVDPRLLKNLPLDLRAVLTWDADNSDMDLWITDPNGERCYYGNRFTYQGGRMSRDFTGGYGPEEFSLRKALPGKYKVEVNFFGERQQIVAGATTLQVKLSSGFGKARVKDQMLTLRLRGNGETVLVGEFEVKP